MVGWIGCDLDHTLAKYSERLASEGKIGEPIPAMVERVKGFLADGYEVRIMTARVNKLPGWDYEGQRKLIEDWTEELFGVRLKVTNEKDFYMIALYDDRAVTVEADTGRLLAPEWFRPVEE